MDRKSNKITRLIVFILFTLCSFPVLAAAPSDWSITHNVQSKIAEDPLLHNIHVNVSTTKQVVSFQGTVNSESEADTLVEIAQSTSYVRDIDTSKLNVKGSNQPLDDSFITAKVKGSFIREKLFGNIDVPAWSIKVETDNGIVYLTGTSNSKKQVENAIKLAQDISGVSKVKYRVKITSNRATDNDVTNY